MDLEVVGRHALLFDDDAMAAFVNSGDALVEWHSLNIDRYDVRHLLSGPPPPRRRNRNSETILVEDLSLKLNSITRDILTSRRSLINQLKGDEYYGLRLLLWLEGVRKIVFLLDVEDDEHRPDSLGYRAVAFSYGSDSADQKDADAGAESSGFLPPFPIPGDLLHCLSRVNGKSLYSGKDDLVGRRTDKKASVLKEKEFSLLDSALCDMPLESDRKEKFKMVIGKSKKDTQETESKGTQQECGITVDAAAAAAILQAATRGIKNSNMHIISSTSPGVHVHVNSSEGIQPGNLGSLPSSRPDNAVEKSGQSESHSFSAVATKGIARTVAGEAAGEADSAEAHLTKEQKLKAERLKRAKLFVAMLKSGEVPFKAGTSRGSSLEPLDSGVSRSASEVNLDGKDREGSLAPVDLDMPATGEKREKNYFGEEHAERLSKRKYRSRAGGCEDADEDDDGDEDTKEHGNRSRRNSGSRSRRHDGDDEDESAEEMKHKHHRKRHRHHSSSEENEDKGESSEEDREHKRHKSKHRSRHSQREDECEDKYKEDKNHKRSRKKHHSHSSSHEHSRKRRSSKQYLQEEDEHDEQGIDKKSRKKHHSHRSSHRSRDKHRHKSGRSSRDKESRRNRKHDTSSDDDRENSSSIDKHKKASSGERNELEEGEISCRVSDESRGIASGRISRETSVDVVSSLQRASSQPSETTTDVPDDLRAKIRAMLMATRV
ncbi:UNVERIFIED_CONTAM: hypothetical protein Slati_2058100 [Sesamum latifolium]|uniref:Suppressor of white apricot N-terminal domain-containing protein n=1 Tax=Sesamum latifolium TaxID=2727402 RepID=A0AAW2WQW1_9LAMI